MAVCWVILRGQQIYTVIQAVHSLLYIVAKCNFFSVVTWKDIIKYLQKCEGCTHFCEILYLGVARYMYSYRTVTVQASRFGAWGLTTNTGNSPPIQKGAPAAMQHCLITVSRRTANAEVHTWKQSPLDSDCNTVRRTGRRRREPANIQKTLIK